MLHRLFLFSSAHSVSDKNMAIVDVNDEDCQIIEAQALSLFVPSSHPNGPCIPEDIITDSGVEVPRLLFHDLASHILGISDLGCLENLSDHFTSLLTLYPYSPLSPSSTGKLAPSKFHLQMLSTHYTALGRRLGSFLSDLHSPLTFSRITSSLLQTPTQGAAQPFLYNPERLSLVFTEAIEPLKEHLLTFPDLLSHRKAEEWYQQIEENFFLCQDPHEDIGKGNGGSLIIGDCWTGSILLEPLSFSDYDSCFPDDSYPHEEEGLSCQSTWGGQEHRRVDSAVHFLGFTSNNENINNNTEERTPRLAILDFEFATLLPSPTPSPTETVPTRPDLSAHASTTNEAGFLTDISQLLAHLLLYHTLSLHRNHQVLSIASTSIINSLMSSYIAKASMKSINKELKSKFLIATAAEILNAAFWRDWDCLCCSSSHQVGGVQRVSKAKDECGLIRQFFVMGLGVLDSASSLSSSSSSCSPSSMSPTMKWDGDEGDVGNWRSWFGLELEI